MRDKAFRERLAQSLNRLRKNVYLFHAVPKRLSPAHYEDLVRVKLAYMDEHPVDDDEPITIDWAEIVATEHDGVVFEFGDCCVQHLAYHLGEDRWAFADHLRMVPLRSYPKTRGDLRRLCAALNIELKED